MVKFPPRAVLHAENMGEMCPPGGKARENILPRGKINESGVPGRKNGGGSGTLTRVGTPMIKVVRYTT